MISAKNLGDAAGHSTVLAELARRGFAERFLVWTKPQTAFLFEGIAGCEVIASPLPLGTANNFHPVDSFAMLDAARSIRRRRPEVSFDLVGDFRERWLARLAGSRRHLQIGWAAGHPFENLIRNPFGKGHPLVEVPRDRPNVYDAYRLFIDRLCPAVGSGDGTTSGKPRVDAQTSRDPSSPAEPVRIGLHPFASQACKLWPIASWYALAARLLAEGFELTAFCAPGEEQQLRAVFGDQMPRIKESAGPLKSFAEEVGRLDLMLGLDSFSIHMAQRQRTASVMLNAGNPPELWAPPDGVVVGRGGGCPHHPCFNVPRCLPGAEYVCVRATPVDEVLSLVGTMLSRRPQGARHFIAVAS